MSVMAKKKQPEDAPKRYPSREKTKYVALPVELYEALEEFARGKSDADDRKSVSWAARVAVRRMLTEEGILPRADDA